VQPPQTMGFPCTVGTPLGQLCEEQPATAIVIIIATMIADCARSLALLGVAGSRAAFGMESLLCRGFCPALVVPARGGVVGKLPTPEEHVPAVTTAATIRRLHPAGWFMSRPNCQGATASNCALFVAASALRTTEMRRSDSPFQPGCVLGCRVTPDMPRPGSHHISNVRCRDMPTGKRTGRNPPGAAARAELPCRRTRRPGGAATPAYRGGVRGGTRCVRVKEGIGTRLNRRYSSALRANDPR